MTRSPDSQGPSLQADQVQRAFPFYLWLDPQLHIRAAGASLCKSLPMLAIGEPLQDRFQLRRPKSCSSVQEWRSHGSDLVTLRALGDKELTLRGNAEVLDDDSVLLLVSPVLTSLEQLRGLGLGFNDFARHDVAGELLLLARATQTALQDTERMASRLKIRSELLDSILEVSRDGVMAFDANNQLKHANAALLHMLGLKLEQVQGLRLSHLRAHVESLLEPDQRAVGLPNRVQPGEQTILRLALPRPAVIEVTLQSSGAGAWVTYWRDITVETEIDRMKSEFLTTAAHELRTPMVSVFGFTELLLNRKMSDDRRVDVLQTIHRQTTRLIQMVNELLDLARIESRQGKDLARRSHAVSNLVEDTVQTLQGGISGHQIACDLPHGTLQLMIDPDKTAQALMNVLSNAVKYSPAGGRIRVSTRSGELAGQPSVGLSIRDSGMGMTPAQLGRIFERFYRADPSGNIPGTGLGMSIAKEIVELQGGAIQVTSEPGVGTEVTLWFPVHAPQTEPAYC